MIINKRALTPQMIYCSMKNWQKGNWQKGNAITTSVICATSVTCATSVICVVSLIRTTTTVGRWMNERIVPHTSTATPAHPHPHQATRTPACPPSAPQDQVVNPTLAPIWYHCYLLLLLLVLLSLLSLLLYTYYYYRYYYYYLITALQHWYY